MGLQCVLKEKFNIQQIDFVSNGLDAVKLV